MQLLSCANVGPFRSGILSFRWFRPAAFLALVSAFITGPAAGQTVAPGVHLVAISAAYPILNTASFSRHALVTVGTTQYVAFYSVRTNVTVGRRILGATNWTFAETSFKPNNPTDGHDIISIGISGDGFLHSSWGMHGGTFNYARTFVPGSLTLVATNMTGAENSVTYPQFLHLPNGDLLYLFREGGSGNGDTYLNRWSCATHGWTNVHLVAGAQAPFIRASGPGSATNANAYPNFEMFDSRTNLHLTWCWREDASTIDTNHDQNYARSPDFGLTWTKWNGTPYTLPITKSTVEIIWPIPTNSTLMNQVAMTIDTNDRPVVCTWWAPKGSGTAPQLMLVWNNGTQWTTNQIGQRSTTQWIKRPIIVCDRSNNLFIVYSDPERGSKPVFGWCTSTNRALWSVADLTSENLNGWEPTYDPVLWAREQKLHVFYQYIGGSTPTTAKVMEIDPYVFLANLPPAPARYTWTNSSGGWSAPGNWLSNSPPPVTGSNNVGITLGPQRACLIMNDFPGAFSLNELAFLGTAAGTNVLLGGPLIFTNNGSGLPVFVQNGVSGFSVSNSITLGADLSVGLNTMAPVSLDGPMSGAGGMTLAGSGQLILSASNSFTGGVGLGSGTLVVGKGALGTGDLQLSGGTVKWLPGNAEDISAGRAVTLSATTAFDPNGSAVSLSNRIAGAGGLTMNGTGTVTLGGANSYDGLTTVSAGMLIAAHPNALGSLAGYTSVAGGTATSALGIAGNISVLEAVRCGGRQPLPNASAWAAHVVNLSGTNILAGDVTSEMGGNQYNIESAGGRLTISGNYSQVAGTGARYLNLQGAGDAEWTGAIRDGTGIINVTKRGSGRWVLSGSNTFTGATIVSEGTLVVDGSLSSNTVTVLAGAVLGGTGVIHGATMIGDGGSLAPGVSAGSLTIDNSLTLGAGSTTLVQVCKAPFTNSSIRATRGLEYGGNLVVTNVSGVLAAGDRFKLFSAASFSGGFANKAFPFLPPSLVWNTTQLGTDGSIWVMSTLEPKLMVSSYTRSNAVLAAAEGTPGWSCRLLMSTNVALPLTLWATMLTNRFDSEGRCLLTVPMDLAASSRFFRVLVPWTP